MKMITVLILACILLGCNGRDHSFNNPLCITVCVNKPKITTVQKVPIPRPKPK